MMRLALPSVGLRVGAGCPVTLGLFNRCWNLPCRLLLP